MTDEDLNVDEPTDSTGSGDNVDNGDTGDAGGAEKLFGDTALTGDGEGGEGEGGEGGKEGEGEGEGDSGDAGGDYEIKFPEGVQVDAEKVAEFKSLVGELQGLSQAEAAQKLVDFQTTLAEQSAANTVKFYTDQDRDWNEAAQKDELISAAGNPAKARELVKKYGGDELIGELQRTRMGNNPALRRFATRTALHIEKLENFIRTKVGEDANIGASEGSSQPEKMDIGDILYGPEGG